MQYIYASSEVNMNEYNPDEHFEIKYQVPSSKII